MLERKLPHLQFESLVCCVPTYSEENSQLELGGTNMAKVISVTGIERKRVVQGNQRTIDLAIKAGLSAIESCGVGAKEFEVLVFVTQTPGYKLPSSAHILQERLNLPESCIVVQVNEGCSGFVYGMYLITKLLQGTSGARGLLVVGDTISSICGEYDASTRPLFGDAVTATVVSVDNSRKDSYVIGGSGKGWKDIWVPNQYDTAGLEGDSAKCNTLHLDGMNVFTFGITRIPRLIMQHSEMADVSLDLVDYFVLHQANRMMNDKIRKKLTQGAEKFPSSLANYGNTSSASIPLTLVTGLSSDLMTSTKQLLLCGFGVGLSWGSVVTHMDPIKSMNLIEA